VLDIKMDELMENPNWLERNILLQEKKFVEKV